MRSINTISLLVHHYDEAIAFYTEKLGFQLLEDTVLADSDKRWVVISPDNNENVEQVTSLDVASNAHPLGSFTAADCYPVSSMMCA